MQIDPLHSVNPAPAVTPTRSEDAAAFRQLVTAVRGLNKSELYGQDRQLEFARDPETRILVIRLVQPSTGEVIRQIPPEQVLHAYQNLEEMTKKEQNK